MRCPLGQHWWMVFAHLLETLKTTSQALREVDGSTRQPSAWNSSFVSSNCSWLSQKASGLSCVPRAALEQVRFSVSVQPTGSVRFADLPSAVVAPPPSSPLLVQAFLPMWPSHRRLRPSSCSLRSSRVLGRRGFALESVAARVCREGGARVTTNMFVRDLHLDVPNAARDGRRLEGENPAICGPEHAKLGGTGGRRSCLVALGTQRRFWCGWCHSVNHSRDQ